METSRILLAVIIAFCLLVLAAATSNARLAQATLSQAQRAEIGRIFAHFTDDTPGAALAITKNGEIIYEQGYGMSNLEYDIPITPSSIFQVGSIAKQFTAMCFILLAQQGKVSIDDDIRKYVPEVPDFGQTITIRHLLYHTSGLRDQWHLFAMAGWRESDVKTQGDVLSFVKRQKELNFKPGEEYLYCNTGYTLLAEVVERISGRSLREFADEHIFNPLRMKNTHFIANHLEIIKNRTYAYAPGSAGGYIINNPVCDMVGPTSLFTTVEDLALWIDNFDHKRVGGEEGVDMLLKRGKLNNGEELYFGLGVMHIRYKGLKAIASGGHDSGYRAEFIMVPEHETAIIIFSNVSNANLSNGNPEGLLYQVADIVLADYIVEPEQQPRRQMQPERRGTPEPPTLTEEQSTEYEGKYYSEELDASQTIVFKDKAIVLRLKKGEEVPLTVKEIDTFSFGSNSIDFLRNEDKRVMGFTITTPTVRNVRFDKTYGYVTSQTQR